jgi:hypothetical protein
MILTTRDILGSYFFIDSFSFSLATSFVVFGRFLRFPRLVSKRGFWEFGHRFPNFPVSGFLSVSAGFSGGETYGN